MTVSGKLTLEEIKELDVQTKMDALGQLWDSIASVPASLPVTDSEKEYLEELYQNYLKNPGKGRSWEEIEGEILEELNAG